MLKNLAVMGLYLALAGPFVSGQHQALARISHGRISDCGDDRKEKCWKGRLFMA
jgi:hypothetical protein